MHFQRKWAWPKIKKRKRYRCSWFHECDAYFCERKKQHLPLAWEGIRITSNLQLPIFWYLSEKKKLKQISFHEKCCANAVMTLYKIKRFTTGASVTESGHCWIDNNSRRNNSASNISKNKFTPMRPVNYKRTTPTPVIFLFESETP